MVDTHGSPALVCNVSDLKTPAGLPLLRCSAASVALALSRCPLPFHLTAVRSPAGSRTSASTAATPGSPPRPTPHAASQSITMSLCASTVRRSGWGCCPCCLCCLPGQRQEKHTSAQHTSAAAGQRHFCASPTPPPLHPLPQLFPYHLGEFVCRQLRLTPFKYYTVMGHACLPGFLPL